MTAPSGNTGPKVRPDWLRFTCPGNDEVLLFVLTGFGLAMGQEVTAHPRLHENGQPQGWIGFENSSDLVTEQGEVIGRFGWGGSGVRGRMCVDLTGAGCELVHQWVEVVRLLENVDARITRCDLCADFLEGEVSVDTALAAFHAGEFASAGKPPSGRLIDDLGSGKGRTLYVGTGQSSRMARIYEKGRQLGQVGSPWVRFEVEFKNRRFELPFGMLLCPDEYLAGAYPVAAKWIEAASVTIRAIRRKATILVGKAILIAKQQVSPTIAFLAQRMQWSSARIVRHLIGKEPSKRIEVSKACERFIEPHQGLNDLIAELHGDRLCSA